jgi:hypothetical protein
LQRPAFSRALWCVVIGRAVSTVTKAWRPFSANCLAAAATIIWVPNVLLSPSPRILTMCSFLHRPNRARPATIAPGPSWRRAAPFSRRNRRARHRKESYVIWPVRHRIRHRNRRPDLRRLPDAHPRPLDRRRRHRPIRRRHSQRGKGHTPERPLRLTRCRRPRRRCFSNGAINMVILSDLSDFAKANRHLSLPPAEASLPPFSAPTMPQR